MSARVLAAIICIQVLAAVPQGAIAATASLETVTTPRGVRQSFILLKPEKPVASVILLAGGHGALGLKSATSMRWGSANFLVRSRELIATRGLQVAVLDAPSDQQDGMKATFRMSAEHAVDIAAVAARLKASLDRPVWLVGTSMGTFSAARGAMGAKAVDGLVLTSTITRSKPHWNIATSHRNGVASLALEQVRVPTLILAHRQDGCDITPPGDVAKLRGRLVAARKVEVVELDGGDPPQSEPCEAKSAHGFLGIEARAVDAIAAFVKAEIK